MADPIRPPGSEKSVGIDFLWIEDFLGLEEFEIEVGLLTGFFELSEKAGTVANVAGCAAVNFDFYQNAVLVVVDQDRFYVLIKAAFLSFFPKFFSGS